ASDFYRFQMKVAPGKTETLTVSEERQQNETIQLSTLNDGQIRHFMAQTAVSDQAKTALKNAMDLRFALHKTPREIAELQRQLKVLTDDQGRLRANMKETPTNTPVYQRYVQKLNDQETQIEKYQADVKRLQGEEHKQNKAFEDYLANLDVK